MTASTTVRKLGGLGQEFGSGGQATVYAVGSDENIVAKLYQRDTNRPSDESLRQIIDWRTALPAVDRAILDERAAWPSALVVKRRRAVGVVMPRIPAKFFARLDVGSGETRERPCELQYLLYPERSEKRGLRLPDEAGRAAICREWLRVFAILHADGIAFGDISMRNLLWSAEGGPSAYVIDCDTAQSMPPIDPSPFTMDWDDPNQGAGDGVTVPADLESDRYKLALVVYRALVGHATARPPPEAAAVRAALPDGVPEPVVEMVRAGTAGDRASRPDPSDWLAAIADWLGVSELDTGPRRKVADAEADDMRPEQRPDDPPDEPVGGSHTRGKHREVVRIDGGDAGRERTARPPETEPVPRWRSGRLSPAAMIFMAVVAILATAVAVLAAITLLGS